MSNKNGCFADQLATNINYFKKNGNMGQEIDNTGATNK
jgi:hypothetical protein